MIAQQVARKYSTALFLSAGRRGLIDQAFEQFSDLKAAMMKDASLLRFLSSPRVAEAEKLNVLSSVFGRRMEQLFLEFLFVLVRKRRAMYLIEVIDEFRLLVEVHRGISHATVTTAVALSTEEKKRLVATLAARTGKKIELETRVDSGIIGGMVVVIGDEIVDGSIKYELHQIEEQLGKIKVH